MLYNSTAVGTIQTQIAGEADRLPAICLPTIA